MKKADGQSPAIASYDIPPPLISIENDANHSPITLSGELIAVRRRNFSCSMTLTGSADELDDAARALRDRELESQNFSVVELPNGRRLILTGEVLPDPDFDLEAFLFGRQRLGEDS